jgi:uncharacterized membrane protein YdfJ with MMPL/SSD domain
MQAVMNTLDGAVNRHRRLVLGVWVALLVVAVPFSIHQSDHLTGGGFGVPGSQSAAVTDQLSRDFPGAGNATLAAVLVPKPDATPAQVRAAIGRVATAAAATDHVALTAQTRAAAIRGAQHPHAMLIPLAVDVEMDKSTDVASDLLKPLHVSSSGPVAVHLTGQGALWAGLQDLSKKDLAKAESAGFPVVLLILLVIFGSLAAASLPLALGFASVLITGSLIYVLSSFMQMSVFVTNMASMIGIGVAVDYSLFVLARYREEIRDGASPDTARSIAMSTSGLAVLFSGVTVIVSLAGLWLVHSTALRSMALGAILVVGVSVLAAVTLLPALIALMGKRAHRPGRMLSRARRALRPKRSPQAAIADAREKPDFWGNWTASVMRRPVLSATAAVVVLLALAAPALNLHTVDGALRQFPHGNETRQGFEAAAKLAGPGAGAPIQVIVAPGQAARARAVLAADPQVAAVDATQRSVSGPDRVLISATPRQDGESSGAQASIERLRGELPDAAVVGGDSAMLHDFHHQVSGSMWKIALFVLALSYLVLLVLLRSAVLPLKAVVMNLLSVGAAFGVLTLVFGKVDTITPPLVLAVVFGLSMDYEVFLLSRIRERFQRHGNTERAVAGGLASSAKTISSAALIMVCVFAIFVMTGVPSIQQIGLGNAVAIAVDATIVRLVLVPATMKLLGRWNWWLPQSLQRALPKVEIEDRTVGTAV